MIESKIVTTTKTHNMGLFGTNIKRILKEFKNRNELFAHDLEKEITESYQELQSEYQQNSEVVPEFEALVNELKPKLNPQDAIKLESFTSKLGKIDKTARNGVDAIREISSNQRKSSSEAKWLYEEYEG